jgi:hypothetical protein
MLTPTRIALRFRGIEKILQGFAKKDTKTNFELRQGEQKYCHR